MKFPDNSAPPYLHWHASCGGCARLIFVEAGRIPGPLFWPAEAVPAKCPHCGQAQAYEPNALVLHSGMGTIFGPEHVKPQAAVIAGMVAAVRLARLDAAEIDRGSPRVRSAIADSVTIARAVLAEIGRIE